MRHSPLARPLRAVLVLLAMTGCAGTSEPIASPVAVSLRLNRISLRSGDTLVLQVTGTNTSAETISVPNYPCLANVEFRSYSNERVAFGDPRYCDLPLYDPRVLAPGATWGDTVTITHPSMGEFRVRAGLPVGPGLNEFVYSDFATVTVRP